VPVPPAPPSAAPLPDSVPMEATRIVMHQIVAPAECDALGICTGGQVRRRAAAGAVPGAAAACYAAAGAARLGGCQPQPQL
jgi:hypothetical protein